MRRLYIVVVVVLGVALLAAGGVIFHQSTRIAELQQQRDSTFESLHESREALHQSQLRLAAAMQENPAPPIGDKAAIAKRDATIQQLTTELNEAKASITQLQTGLSAAKDESQKALKASDQNLHQMKTELQAQLDELQKQLSSTQTDLQNSRQRIAALQKVNDQLSNANNAGSTRTAEREHILASLQDIDRRRESYLTRIADRYRSLTNQFRTMSGMLDSNRNRDSSAFSGPALDMIQNAISLTDDDLQHVGELNAKAFRLEKQLSKK
jgi:chromosome segregation ATPase